MKSGYLPSMPKFTGTIQIDETFFKESQKGSRKLVSYVKEEKREPRYGRIPSKMGTMGNEFATVVCMTDLRGYSVAKLVSLGKLTTEAFYDLFDEYIENPTFICTDANNIYKEYCKLKNYPHYIKPSNYLEVINKHGYITPSRTDDELAKKQDKDNQKVLLRLYWDNLIDYIDNNGGLGYTEFYHIKNANTLSLAYVNQFHSELKRHIEYNTKGVSTKYLEDYVGFYTFVRNWRVSNGHYPSSKTDAESILVDILKGRTTYTTADLNNAELNIPKASGQYMAMLKKKTTELRKAVGDEYVKFDSEDRVVSFNKRQFLESLPKCKLEVLRRKYKIDCHWPKFSVVGALCKQDGIENDILNLIYENKAAKHSEEDELAIKDRIYAAEKYGHYAV